MVESVAWLQLGPITLVHLMKHVDSRPTGSTGKEQLKDKCFSDTLHCST